MTGDKRREEIISAITNAESPVPARRLAELFKVSRQVIVQDIALIRASGHDIISTNRGYCLNKEKRFKKVFKVRHTDSELEKELCAIVDMGGTVENVMVNHRVYGHIEAELDISSRLDVSSFLENIKNGKSSPLKNITSDYHYHTVTAGSEEALALIEESLRKNGFLVET